MSNLQTIHLPPGAVTGFDLGWDGWNGSQRTKHPHPRDLGYDGVRFIGAGRDRTHVVPTLGESYSSDSTVFIGPGCGLVSFEDLTLHCGPRKGIHVGLPRPLNPDGTPVAGEETLPSTLRMRRARLVSDPPTDGRPISTVWGVMTHQTDIDWADVEIEMPHSAEHGCYVHGYSERGVRWKRVTVRAVGAEGLKVTARPHECMWVKGAKIVVEECDFANWFQPGSWRGGAGMTVQGGGANVLVRRSRFRGGPGNRGKCLMIDDGSSSIRDPETLEGKRYYGPQGELAEGSANGYIDVTGCSMSAGPGTASITDILRVGRASQHVFGDVAEGVHVHGGGYIGERTVVSISGVPKVAVSGCNRDEWDGAARSKGFDPTHSSALHVDDRWIEGIEHGLRNLGAGHGG